MMSQSVLIAIADSFDNKRPVDVFVQGLGWCSPNGVSTYSGNVHLALLAFEAAPSQVFDADVIIGFRRRT